MNIIKWYSETKFHQWWVDNVWKPSWTNLVAAFYGIPSALALVGVEAAKLANDTTVSGYLNQIGVPNWVFGTLATIALVQYVAHGRED